jgi:hypothetical protein
MTWRRSVTKLFLHQRRMTPTQGHDGEGGQLMPERGALLL